MDLRVSRGDLLLFSDRNFLTHPGVPVETTEGLLWDAGGHMGRVKSLRNGSGAAATAARAGAAVWACRPAAGEESAAAELQQIARAAIRAILTVWVALRRMYRRRAQLALGKQTPAASRFLNFESPGCV